MQVLLQFFLDRRRIFEKYCELEVVRTRHHNAKLFISVPSLGYIFKTEIILQRNLKSQDKKSICAVPQYIIIGLQYFIYLFYYFISLLKVFVLAIRGPLGGAVHLEFTRAL